MDPIREAVLVPGHGIRAATGSLPSTALVFDKENNWSGAMEGRWRGTLLGF